MFAELGNNLMAGENLYIMPKPDVYEELSVQENISSNLPSRYRYESDKFSADVISMFEKKSAKGRLRPITNEWVRTALDRYRKDDNVSLLDARQTYSISNSSGNFLKQSCLRIYSIKRPICRRVYISRTL